MFRGVFFSVYCNLLKLISMKINHSTQSKTFLFFSLFLCTYLMSQNGNGNGNGQPNNQWKITGNDADTNNFIGTTNFQDIKFRTNNVEHLRLTKEGELGLGTTNPAAKLDVYGNVILRNLLRIPNTPLTSDLTNKFQLVVDAFGNIEKTLIGNYPPWNPPLTICDLTNPDGTIGIINPYWASGLNKLYTQCPSVNVGIATTTPRVNLDVRGNAFMNKLSLGSADPLAIEAYLHLKAIHSPVSIAKMILLESNEQELLSLDYQGLLITKTINAEKIVINAPDNNESSFVIQTASQKLLQMDNNGLLHARKVKVDTQIWPDYVFKDSYSLMPILEVEKFIEAENHLPNIPTEQEMVENGIDLSEMNVLLMEKIEELVLYSIDQQKQINQLIYQVQELGKTNENR